MSNEKNIIGHNFLLFTVYIEIMVLLVTFINKLNEVSFQTLSNVDIVYICFMYDFFFFSNTAIFSISKISHSALSEIPPHFSFCILVFDILLIPLFF